MSNNEGLTCNITWVCFTKAYNVALNDCLQDQCYKDFVKMASKPRYIAADWLLAIPTTGMQ